ncbi:MAG: hypothetical protein K6C13_11115 [Oscillospiraceae bacterium]|nr:hypothetical protein [Oscillospiraceae bacterium]
MDLKMNKTIMSILTIIGGILILIYRITDNIPCLIIGGIIAVIIFINTLILKRRK